jgi:cell division septum initiation protein DivIVA
MDILHLVDRLEDLIDEGRHIPLSKYTMIDEERALEIIDQMRISIPEEIEKATRIIQQRDRLMAQANEEAARMVELAKEKGDTMVSRESIAQAAQGRAAGIIEMARREAETMQVDADNYVMEVLGDLESHLIRSLTVVRNGINSVNQRAQDPANGAAPAQLTATSQQAPVEPSVTVQPDGTPIE